jgi:RHS repeat-associated protein
VSRGIRAYDRLIIYQWYVRAAKAVIPDRVREHGFFVSAIKEKRQAFRIAMTPCGRRLWKDVDGIRTYFLYSDEGLIGEYDSTGNQIKTYGWSPNSIWGTDPLFLKINGYYYFYQNDHLGTPQKLIGSNGLVVWAGVYDSFGTCQIEVEGITNNLRFPGQYYDEETGLHYNWLRYYDPGTGRFLSTDPFRQGLNLYAYCFNNPISQIDPWGLCTVKTDLHRPEATAWRTAVQLADIAPIPHPLYQIPMELAAFGTTLMDITVADVPWYRKLGAGAVGAIGILGVVQAIPTPPTVLIGTVIDAAAYIAVSSLLGDPYPAASLIEYLKGNYNP